MRIVVIGDAKSRMSGGGLLRGNGHMPSDGIQLEIGSCWIRGKAHEESDVKTTEEYVREKLGFPENYKLEAILSLGMPAVKMPAYQLEELPMEKVKWEKF